MRLHHLDRYDLCAAIIILLAILLRFLFIASGWPASYNDEGTLGLMALHIAYHGAHPLLYYGQDYLGSMEAYLGAFFFHLLGPSTFALRLSLLGFFAGFLIFLYLLTMLLYSKGLALLTLILLAAGSPDVVYRQLMANGGDPDYFFFTTLLLLLTSWLALTANRLQGKLSANDEAFLQGKKHRRLPWSRVIAYAAWGIVAGIDIWSYPLCLPFVLCAAILLAFFCRRELRFPVLSLLLVCFLIGVSPFIIYKATVPVTPTQNSLFGGGYREPPYPALNGLPAGVATTSPASVLPRPGLQFVGTVLVAIPVATNGTMICPVSSNEAWPLTTNASTRILVCTGVHGVWGIGYLVLGFIASFAAIRWLRRYWQSSSKRKFAQTSSATPESAAVIQRDEAVRQAARLMILIGAGLTLIGFILFTQASAVTPWLSARYLAGLLIALPAVLYPLWKRRDVLDLAPGRIVYLKTAVKYSIPLIIFVACLLGTINIFTVQLPQANASDQGLQQLIDILLQKGGTRIYTTYNDCDRLAFLSDERIICAALDDGLRPGLDRYYPYRQVVADASHPFYVFPINSRQSLLLEQKAGQEHLAYKKYVMSGYNIYDPVGAYLI